MLEQTELMIPMRDGVHLAATRYRQADVCPVLLMRIPYGRKTFADAYLYSDYEQLTKMGICVVIQDVRGTGGSEGTLQAQGGMEAQDGYDTVEWLAAQPWCSGRVGMYGLSYMGFAQMAAGSLNPPHLVCLCPFQNGALTPFSVTSAMTVGVFHLMWLYGRVEADIDRLKLDDERKTRLLDTLHENRQNWKRLMLSLPLQDLQAAHVPDAPVLAQFSQFISHVESPTYWRKIGRPVPIEQINVPMLMLTGWFDGAKDGTLENYARIMEKGTPQAKAALRLVIGPWTHGGTLSSVVDGVDFGQAGSGQAIDINGMAAAWCLQKLCGQADDTLPRVKYYMLGEQAWHTSDVWPPKNTRDKRLYLHADGGMDDTKQDDERASTYLYDPGAPRPSEYTDIRRRTLLADPGTLDERSDGLIYRTGALNRPVTIAGNVVVHLYAVSTAVDTDFFCFLSQVDEQGIALPLTEGVVRARYRTGRFRPRLLTPGKAYHYTISLGALAVRLPAGHSLRLDISSSDYPRHDRNLNTGEKIGCGAYYQTARQMVLYGKSHPTCLLLPLVYDEQ